MPPYIDPETWADFIEGRREMQKKNRIPFTAVAQKRILLKLEKMHQEGHDVNQALEDAICNSWRSVFPPKQQALRAPTQASRRADTLSGLMDTGYANSTSTIDVTARHVH